LIDVFLPDESALDIPVPVIPKAAKVQTAAGAMAIACHYFTVLDYAYAIGNAAPLAAISDPRCKPCAGAKDMINTSPCGWWFL
jgi:hypothetical protein